MKIIKIINRIRRDFTAIYECEHCRAADEGPGYDDANFHLNVVPKMKCKSCGKTADENYLPLATRYPEGMEV